MIELDKISGNVIEKLQTAGADKAYCTVATSVTREFNVDGGAFSLMRTLFDNSLALTGIVGGKKGSVGINRFDDGAVEQAVADCMASASSSEPDPAWDLAPNGETRSFTQGVLEADTDRLFDRTAELMEQIGKKYPKIMVEQLIVSHVRSHSVYRNTNGAFYTKDAGYYNVELMFSAHEGETASSFFGTGAITDNLDRPFMELGSIEKDLADVEKQIHTELVDGKFTGVMLLPPGCLGSFLGDIADNFASDGPVLEGTSIWKDKLGEQVADPRITISFAPGDKEIVCGQSYTTEGFLAQDFDFIREGKLESFLIGLYVSNKTGVPRAKNDGGSMVMRPGDRSLEEIIASIEKGILVGRFSGGQPSTNGDFSGVAKNSFLIENGKITHAVSETLMSGNLADMLQNVVAISRDRVADGSSVLPYAAFDGITVSGK